MDDGRSRVWPVLSIGWNLKGPEWRADMIDSFVKIVEKLIELRRYREDRNRRLFNDTVSLIFKDIEEIHRDYLQMFSACEMSLEENESLSKIVKDFRKARLKYEPTRRRILIILAELAGKTELAQFQWLFFHMHSYFSKADSSVTVMAPMPSGFTRSSRHLTFMERTLQYARWAVDSSAYRRDIIFSTREWRKRLESDWHQVCESYAKAFTKSL